MLTIAFWVLVYFLPAIVGFYRKHHRAWAIFALNLFLGWTVVGWIVAMVWAATRASLSPDRRDRQEMLNMRATMMGIHKLIFPENQKTGAILRMKIGLCVSRNTWKIDLGLWVQIFSRCSVQTTI